MHSRRQLMRLGAASLFAAPFYRLLEPSYAASGSGPSRLLLFFSPNGTVHEHWRPEGSDANYSFRSGSILEPLQGLESDLLVLDGMDFCTGDNHEGGMAAMLTAGGSTSIDQVIADAIGGGTRFSSLELGALTSAWGGSTQTRMCYRDGSFITPDDNPTSVWKRLYGDLGDESLLARRQSVLDLATSELDALHMRLGHGERIRLEAHLESLRDVEKSLSGGGDCESPISPGNILSTDNDAFPDIVRAQIDLAIQSLACDITRVASVQLSHTVSPVVFTWLNETDGHHSLSHADDTNTAGINSFIHCERWFAEQFAYLVNTLKGMTDPATGESMLSSTLVLWVKELGDGRMHTCTDVPWIIAGDAGGYFSPGRYLQLGTTHDAVLTSVCNAFGLTNTSFGVGNAPAAGALR
jgi:hypothetical protein